MKKNYIIPTFVCVELKGETICAESDVTSFSLGDAEVVSSGTDLDTKGEKNEWKSLWDDAW